MQAIAGIEDVFFRSLIGKEGGENAEKNLSLRPRKALGCCGQHQRCITLSKDSAPQPRTVWSTAVWKLGSLRKWVYSACAVLVTLTLEKPELSPSQNPYSNHTLSSMPKDPSGICRPYFRFIIEQQSRPSDSTSPWNEILDTIPHTYLSLLPRSKLSCSLCLGIRPWQLHDPTKHDYPHNEQKSLTGSHRVPHFLPSSLQLHCRLRAQYHSDPLSSPSQKCQRLEQQYSSSPAPRPLRRPSSS